MTATRLNRGPWSMYYYIADGGLILEDVRHDNFSLAEDIRMTRVWIDTEYPDKTDGKYLQDFKLNTRDFTTEGEATVLEPARIGRPGAVNSSVFFGGYVHLFGLSATFKSNFAYLAGTPNECGVDLTQKYLFGNYGKNPPHEAFSVLDATRLFPLLSFSFPAVVDKSMPYPKYFRADYRLDIGLDNIDESSLLFRHFNPGDTRNKAAIFRDKESAPGAWGILGQVFLGDVYDLFQALEKPLNYEIASWGLVAGNPPARVSKRDTWDNIHMWPAKRDGSVSTPGAFHAFHCHWRWGAASGDPSQRSKMLPGAGSPQFTGVGWKKSAGGALVDSKIPKQNLQFAVTKNDHVAWRPEANASEREFKSLFTSLGKPRDVIGGDDLVLWLSFEVFRDEAEPGKEWAGSLFVNGFYFAHNVDNTSFGVAVGGAYGEGWKPIPFPKWERLAR